MNALTLPPDQVSPASTRGLRAEIDLAGEWRFQLDEAQRGVADAWRCGLPAPRTIGIERPWEYWIPDYDGVAWYEKNLVLPQDWAGRQAVLQFDAVSYYCDCWLNGIFLGSHEGGFTPFEFETGAHARFGGENILVVRVINPPTNREVEGFRSGAPLNQSDIPIGKAAWYYNFGGIWQGARFLSRPRCAVQDLRVFPDLRNRRIRTDVVFSSLDAPGPVALRLSVRTNGGVEAAAVDSSVPIEAPGITTHRFELPLGDLEKWSLSNPALHNLRVEIVDGPEVRDRFERNFGVREFTIANERFELNGAPVFLNGFLHQGCYPRTLAVPETREFAWAELQDVKRRGFNFLRITMKPAPTWYLDMADRIGLLIMHEPPIGWIANGPKTRERCLREISELAARDANHPSVVIFGLFNESFHLLGFMPEEVLQITAEMALAARQIDPSRLIIDTSGGFSRKVLSGPDTMIHDTGGAGYQISRAWRPWREDFLEIFDVHKYCRFPASDADVESYRTLPAPGQLLFLAEYGAPETPPDFDSVLKEFRPDEAARELEDWKLHRDFGASLQQRFQQSGLDRHMPSVSDFIATVGQIVAGENRRIAHAIRSNPAVGGMCFCQLADASGELFGAMDSWRRPKPLYDALTSASANPAVGLHLPRRILLEGESAAVRATIVADHGVRYAGRVELSLASGSGEAAWKTTIEVPARAGVADLFDATVTVPLTEGTWEFRARFDHSAGGSNEHAMDFYVLPKPVAKPRTVALRDVNGILEKYLRASDWKIVTYGNNYRGKNTPVLLNLEAIPKNRAFYAELYGQLRKIVQLGGCAILFEPEVHALYRWLFPDYIAPQSVMRTCPYTLPHPIFNGLPDMRVADHLYAEVFPDKWDKGEDVVAADGEVYFGAYSMHMWTRPAAYFWAAGIYRVPIGRGNVIVCHLPIAQKVGTSPVARQLLENLVRYASSLIKPGGEAYLAARCIDPLPKEALA